MKFKSSRHFDKFYTDKFYFLDRPCDARYFSEKFTMTNFTRTCEYNYLQNVWTTNVFVEKVEA